MFNRENLIDIFTIFIASFLTIYGLIFTYFYPRTQILVLTILTILLPIIY